MATTRTPDDSWLAALADRDSRLHADLDGEAAQAEIRSLRERNAALVAALAEARHGVTIRERLLAELTADANETHARLARLESDRDAATSQIDAMVGSTRWRIADAAVGAARLPLNLARRLRGRAS